jgi:hypothetical protein
MHHLTDLDILGYAAGALRENALLRADEHAGECDACRSRLRAAVYLASSGPALLEGWTASMHGEAHRRWRLLASLAHAAGDNASVLGRARRWLRSGTAMIGQSTKLLMRGADGIGLLSSGWTENGITASLRPALAGAASPDAARAWESTEAASRLLQDGEAEASADEIANAVRIDARMGQSSTLEVRQGDALVFRIVTDSRRKTTAVMRWPSIPADWGSLAVLIPNTESALPAIATFSPVEGTDYLLASFTQIPDGEYVLEIEPSAAQEQRDGR